MKILLIGLGSIGRRHLSCLRKIKGVTIAAYRTRKGQLQDQVNNIQIFDVLEEALLYKPDGVIIANPTALHVETASPFLKVGCKVLIEKPIDQSFELASKLSEYEHLIRVAYCMRFLPVNVFLNQKFKEEIPYKISFKRSFYLPKWHPYADYTKEYTAKKELGGGVIRTLSHEIDLMVHWLGMPQSLIGITDKISHLEIDTDDFAFFTAKMTSGARVNFELDFFSPQNINIGEAFTLQGKYTWNFNDVWFTPYSESEAIPIEMDSQNVIDIMYQNQIDNFIQFVKGEADSLATFNDSLQVLKIIETVDEK